MHWLLGLFTVVWGALLEVLKIDIAFQKILNHLLKLWLREPHRCAALNAKKSTLAVASDSISATGKSVRHDHRLLKRVGQESTSPTRPHSSIGRSTARISARAKPYHEADHPLEPLTQTVLPR